MYQFNLEGFRDYHPSYRAQFVLSLADFRRDWEKMAEGKSLIDIKASVGLIIADIADRLELNAQERYVVLGGKLSNQVNCVMEERVRAKLPS